MRATDLGRFSQVGEPGDDLPGRGADREEGEEGEDHGYAETPDGNAGLGAFAQELGRVAVEGETVESS